ncbi:MAG: hypothetical protein ABIW36_03255 [Terrimesophilobacter sp.]
MILEIFGWLGSVLLLYSLTQAHPRRFRYLNLAACLALLTYNLLREVYPAVAVNTAIALINVWFIWQIWIQRKAGTPTTAFCKRCGTAGDQP